MRALRGICDTHGALLIADEVQCGFARTGRMFGVENSGVEPDLLTIAKSLGGGFPIAGVIGRAALMDAVDPGGLGSTYGGNPVACAAALAVLEVIEEEKLLERATAVGQRLRGRLAMIQTRNDIVPIGRVRGPGAMVAFDIVEPGAEHQPHAAQRVARAALDDGLIILTCGVYGNTIRILVPLTASDALIDEGLDKLEGALVLARAA
jgi:4-aminobutyrate aminotransferase/(S)-3-amino-2-methylpropionate transaminase